MKARAAFVLATLAGFPAAAWSQTYMRVEYSWTEVNAGTTVPVASPNSILNPGEGARIALRLTAVINGVSAVGQTMNYPAPPPPGVGTVRGVGAMVYNLRGDGGAATASGTWGPRSISSSLSTGAHTGIVMLSGAMIDSLGGGQFVAPGGTAIATNPINNAFRGVWTPSSYAYRTVNFKAEPGTAVPGPSPEYPTGQHNTFMLAYSITRPDPNDPSTWYDNLLPVYVDTDFGNGLNIQIAGGPCYANCDGSAISPILNANDFQCFLNRFAAGDSYANCDGSTNLPVLTVNDFQCFLNSFAAGCT